MTSVRLQQIGKSFGSTVALDRIDLSIVPGELLFLLGPSGCGKSTLLRIVAGLLEPTAGRIFFDDRDVTNLPTEQRSAVMCFQNYALWPHMTVYQNVAFGLTLPRRDQSRVEHRAMDALRMVQLEQYAQRKPNALSGGQQQRAALARALAVGPKCLLLDEPLSNLDAKLRIEMRGEIRRICKSAGYTTIYVTHDQKEALSIADRIVLLQSGRIAQIGSPAELYYKPRSSFVADFIGQANLLSGEIEGITGGVARVRTPIGTLAAAAMESPNGRSVVVSIRPERIHVVTSGSSGLPAANQLSGTLVESTFLGEMSEHLVEVGGRQLRISASPPILEISGNVKLQIEAADCIVLPE
jgi:iron(III) transport system ATP-binding protein